MRIAFLLLKRLVRLPEMRMGTAPTEFAYGALELSRTGHDVEILEIDPYALSNWPDPLRLSRLVFGKNDLRHFKVARRLIEKLNLFDCVVSMCGKTANALSLFGTLGWLKSPVIGIRCGVLNERLNPFARRVHSLLLRRSHTVLFGEGERAPFMREFSLSSGDVTVNQFGVDHRFWTPGEERGDFVLSVGNDPQRDYATLLAAAPLIRAPIHIVTTRSLPSPVPGNVTVTRGSLSSRNLTDLELRSLYRRARCVVTPLRETLQPSGQSSTLQAMACGTPVVLTETRGLWSRAMMRNGENVLLTPPKNAGELAAKVTMLLETPSSAAAIGAAARHTVETGANIDSFGARLAEICVRVVAAHRPAVIQATGDAKVRAALAREPRAHSSR